MDKSVSGVILAGGLSRRFGGKTKSLLEIGGERIIDRLVSVLENLFPEIFIVTNTPDLFTGFQKYKIVQDYFENAGPLGGIDAALRSVSGEAIFVIAGDMPFPDKQLIRTQLNVFWKNHPDALIPEIGNLIEPLHAIYSSSLLNDMENYLRENKDAAVRDFLKGRNILYYPLPDTTRIRKAFTNINSPEDLSRLNDILISKGH
jgi:molybdopterin-guanine dinucleotide biosynthesis protein A